jgi:hypothetical protein
MNRKPLDHKDPDRVQGATILSPGDFPLGSLQSRAAARLRLQGIGGTGEGSLNCICFPEDEQPFFCSPAEEPVAARVKCPLHGSRFKPIRHRYVAAWLAEKEPSYRRRRRSAQYRKAWAASFPPDLWPAEEVEVRGKMMLHLKDGILLTAE